jgi:TonB family protein
VRFLTSCWLCCWLALSLGSARANQAETRAPQPAQDLLSAAKSADLDTARRLLESGADIEATDPDGLTALQVAIAEGHPALARFLILHGADVNARDLVSHTPLHWAALADDLSVARLLIDRHAKVNVATNIGTTALHLASMGGDPQMIRLLAAAGADLEAKDVNDMTPLLTAASWGRADATDALIELGASTARVPPGGLTALHLAAGGRGLMQSFLVKPPPEGMKAGQHAGIPEPKPNDDGEYVKVMQRLIAAGIDPNTASARGATPLHFAAVFGCPAEANFLLERAADPKAVTQDGQTPLHVAATTGHLDTAKLLVSRGADLEARDSLGQRAIDKAEAGGHAAVGDFLRAAGQSPPRPAQAPEEIQEPAAGPEEPLLHEQECAIAFSTGKAPGEGRAAGGQLNWSGPGLHSPIVVFAPSPQYTQKARKERINGTVLVQVLINEEGRVECARVLRSLEPSLDAASIDTVNRWRFKPATFQGQPVAMLYSLSLNFTIQ